MRFRSPALIYVLIWGFVLFLYSLKWSEILTPLNSKTVSFLILSALIISFPTIIYQALKVVITATKNTKEIVRTANQYNIHPEQKKKLRILFKGWAFFSLLEIGIFKSIPLLSFFGIGQNYTYYEWGIPTLHGLLNAVFSVISNYIFYIYLKTKRVKYLFYFFGCLIWPILLVSRILFLSIFVEALFIFLFFVKIRATTFFKSLVIFISIILVFGIVGDIRSGGDSSQINNLAKPTREYPQFLPSGFLWVYLYITSPISNINYNIETFRNFDFRPDVAFSNILPSIIKSKIAIDSPNNDFQLVNEVLNVSTFHFNYLMSFGYYGALLFYLLYGILFLICQHNAFYDRNIKSVFILVLILHNVIFTTFSDLFLLLPFAFQLIVHFLVGTRIKLK